MRSEAYCACRSDCRDRRNRSDCVPLPERRSAIPAPEVFTPALPLPLTHTETQTSRQSARWTPCRCCPGSAQLIGRPHMPGYRTTWQRCWRCSGRPAPPGSQCSRCHTWTHIMVGTVPGGQEKAEWSMLVHMNGHGKLCGDNIGTVGVGGSGNRERRASLTGHPSGARTTMSVTRHVVGQSR